MGAHHARVMQTSRARLGVVVDRHRERAERLARRAGCPASDRLEDAFGCDAAIVAAPAEHHAEIALALLEAGRPVLVEKPMADELVDVRRILDVSERSGVPVMCGFVERFNPAVAAAAALLNEAPVHMIAVRHSPPVPRIRTSVVHDLLIHDIDLAVRFAGGVSIERIAGLATAPAGSYSHEQADCILGFADGAIANLSANRVSQRKVRTFAIQTPSLLIDIDLARQEVVVCRHGIEGGSPDRTGNAVDVPPVRPIEPLARQLTYFLALAEGQEDADGERRQLLPSHVAAARLLEP
jgi:predicted dehydrogenase